MSPATARPSRRHRAACSATRWGSLRQRVQPERHRVTDLCVGRSVRDDSDKNNTFNNASCDVDAAFLASLPSRTPLSATGGINSRINPDLNQNKTYEASARIERELIPNVALSGGWVYHRINNLYFNTQINRPYDEWVPATPATPFLDQNGQPVTSARIQRRSSARPSTCCRAPTSSMAVRTCSTASKWPRRSATRTSGPARRRSG